MNDFLPSTCGSVIYFYDVPYVLTEIAANRCWVICSYAPEHRAPFLSMTHVVQTAMSAPEAIRIGFDADIMTDLDYVAPRPIHHNPL